MAKNSLGTKQNNYAMLMVQKAFISNADAALTDLIWKGLENEAIAKNITSSREQISFSSPKANVANRKLSIFLYHITKETALGNVSFALHYLVTPFTGNDKDDHVLLEKIVALFSATPQTASADAQSNVDVIVKIDSVSSDELSRLWTALGAPLKLSLTLTVSYPELPSDNKPQAAAAPATPPAAPDINHVMVLYHAVHKTFLEQSEDWSNRTIVIKQWLFQDFKKNTGVTVEEMRASLASLGDKLEAHQSTARFIKPLNLLARYYEHQLENLKGFRKISSKQQENLETINAWIKDVKALVETLEKQL